MFREFWVIIFISFCVYCSIGIIVHPSRWVEIECLQKWGSPYDNQYLNCSNILRITILLYMPKHLWASCHQLHSTKPPECRTTFRLCCEQSTVQLFLQAAIKEFGQGGGNKKHRNHLEFSMFEGFVYQDHQWNHQSNFRCLKVSWILPSLKLTYPLKIGHPKRKLVFQPSIFRGYVSFMNPKSNRLPSVQSLAGIGWAPEMLALPGGGGKKCQHVKLLVWICWGLHGVHEVFPHWSLIFFSKKMFFFVWVNFRES